MDFVALLVERNGSRNIVVTLLIEFERMVESERRQSPALMITFLLSATISILMTKRTSRAIVSSLANRTIGHSSFHLT
jgi:hypothetical protein